MCEGVDVCEGEGVCNGVEVYKSVGVGVEKWLWREN